MALVNFKRGLAASLPKAITDGTFYVTTDERAIYLDIDGKRIRIGDFQEYASVEALNANPNPSTTALYYVKDINCLAKYDGEKYVQINPDTGATTFTATGEGNAITEVSYNAANRTLTLTKGKTFLEAADLSGINTDIEELKEKVGDKAVSEQISEAIDDLELDDTYVKVGDLDDDIAQAEKAGTDAMAEAQKKVASVTAGDGSITVGGTDTAPTVAVAIDDTDGNKLTLVEGKGLRVEVPSADVYDIVKDDNSGDFAAIYHLTKNGVNTGAAINIPKDMVVKSGKVETEGDTTYIVLVLNDKDNTEIKIDASKLIEYVTSGSETGDMVVITISEDHKVTAAITDGTITEVKLHADVKAKLDKAHTHENAEELAKIQTGDKDKWDGAAAQAEANKNAIAAIKDSESIDSFKDVEDALAGKQDKIEDETYDEYGAAEAVKEELIGEEGDEADADTINGAKAYADEAVETALTWGTF